MQGDECECLEIYNPDLVIELYERKILQETVRDDYQIVWQAIEQRYPHL